MSREGDPARLRHMLDAASRAVELIEGKQRKDLDQDDVLVLALTRLLEITGEAAKYVSPAVQERHGAIPWREISGTRDRLIHGYFDVDLDIVWEIVSVDLPQLLPRLREALERIGEP